jgi:hypothetical protein
MPAFSKILCAVTLVALAVCLGGCREVSADRLYAIKLDQPPGEAEWQRALPRLVTVRGGRPHKLPSFAEIDEDTVHTTTASCHHGSRLPDPILVDMRAFYTDSDIFLRLVWKDATADRNLMEWVADGAGWQNSGSQEDGFGLMWDATGQFPRFTCSYACHIQDFGVSRSSFHASNKMKLAGEGAWLDLWNWKADRTARFDFADDRFLDHEGIKGDLPGELFHPNSRLAREQGGDTPLPLFGAADQPLYAADFRPLGAGPFPAGTRLPGYLVDRPAGGRADVTAIARHRGGHWQVTLRRALATGEARDVVFVPGDSAGVTFGLAVMDHTLFEHYASVVTERLVLLDALQATHILPHD